jgi:carbon-monoxide dehydrogenase small subunit
MSDCLAHIRFTVNGEDRAMSGPPMKRLLDVLREDLRLTGTKEGCGEGECGSCSVRMNGELVNSCLVPVLQAEGARFRPLKGWRDEAALCIHCNRRFSIAAARSAASARRAC